MKRMRVSAALVFLALVALGACSAGHSGGLDIGDLKTYASRVNGGGIECPLRFDSALLRPAAAPRNAIIAPMRVDGFGSMGTIGSEHPGTPLAQRKGVQIDCWFQIGTTRVDLELVGVQNGKALGQLAAQLQKLSQATPAQLLTFIDVNAKMGPGQAQVMPGSGVVAYAPVKGSGADIGLLVGYSPLAAGAVVPKQSELKSITLRVASSLAN